MHTNVATLTNKEYWDKTRSDFVPFRVDTTVFSHILEKILPFNPNYTCADIGAYPGRYLVDFAKRFGYHPVAIEYSDHCEDIETLFEYNGIENYTIINKDFFQIKNIQFDVVFSNGFIEHFDDYETVMDAHFKIVKKGGYLIVSVPYIGGFQGILRRLTYIDEKLNTILSTHNLKIMDLDELKRVMSLHPCEIVYAEYINHMRIWFFADSPFVRDSMRWLVGIVNYVDKKIGKKIPSSKYISPTILVVVKKH